MPVFSVVATSTPVEVEKKLNNTFPPSDIYKVDDKQWFVSSAMINTPKELCEKAAFSNGEGGTVIVVLFASYFGFHNRGVWEWLTSKGL
ncbi:hypothetical protein BS639_17065 [Rouxiella silvae]|uniref:Uncharacterized protein n=1 Tax=Rouxiella silvae TaxID=1646373 RepID=A0ABX3TXV2_9GAMM|nr:hypothetical protein [Rouxiella silvae]ORJ20005.1 hypothetical protein BS639_17065 [Rouxiella silvae]